MKIKTTKKSIRESFSKIIAIGYCNAQNLLYYKNPFAYSAGVTGWSCDYYNVHGVCLSTGYSPVGMIGDYSLIRDLDKEACAIVNDFNLSYEKKVEKVNELLNRLIASL